LQNINTSIVIRPATVNDIPTIQSIVEVTWPIAYSEIVSSRQLNYMINLWYSSSSLEEQMYLGRKFFVAEMQEEVIGFAAYKEEAHQGVYKLDRLYVLPNNQQLGLGKSLLMKVVSEVIELGGKEIILQVHRKNKAVCFYKKMGFEIKQSIDFPIGEDFFMNDYIMSLLL